MPSFLMLKLLRTWEVVLLLQWLGADVCLHVTSP